MVTIACWDAPTPSVLDPPASIRSMLALCVILAVCSVIIPASAVGSPQITIDHPVDGEWTTYPEIMVDGTSAPGPTVNSTISIQDLGPGLGNSVRLDEGVLVFRPICHFADDFNGNSLDGEVWSVRGAGGWVEVYGGCLRFFGDKSGGYPLVLSQMIMNPESDWTVETRVAFEGYVYNTEEGAGLTSNLPDPLNSFTAWLVGHNAQINEDVIDLYAEGSKEYSIYNDMRWHTLTIHHIRDEKKCVVTMDGVAKCSVLPFGDFSFWFGNVSHGLDPHFPSIKVDYADVWTFHGDWTSEIFDMGKPSFLDGANLSMSSTAPASADSGLEVRGSPDGVNWSSWMDCSEPLGATTPFRYLQFRLALSLDGVRNANASISVRSIGLRLRYPVESVEVRTADGEWRESKGTDRWSAVIGLLEDQNTITARCFDTAGGVAVASVNLTLDTIRPLGTAAIRGPRPYVNDLDVTLLLNATDSYGVASVGVSYYPDFYDETILPFSPELPWHIQGGFGENTLYVRFYDTHGLVSIPTSATIVYDPFPPSGGLSIDGGARYSPDIDVRLDLKMYDEFGLLSAELSNGPDMQGARTVPVGSTSIADWRLSPGGDGPRTVYLRLTDLAGNIAIVNASIDLYLPKALGGIRIENGAGYTNKTVVLVSVDVPTELHATAMQLSLDPGFADGVWEAVGAERYFILPKGDYGVRLFARFLDFRGFPSLPVNATIVLDTTPPVISVKMNDGSTYTTNSSVKVAVTYEDSTPASKMWRCADGRFDLAQAGPFEGSFDWTVPTREGDWTVHVRVEDAARNPTTAVATIHFATKRTVFSFVLHRGSPSNATTSLPIDVMYQDPYGGIEIQTAIDTDPTEGSTWSRVGGVVLVEIGPGTSDGRHEVRARARNAAGLVSDVVIRSFILDRTPPRVAVLEPANNEVLIQKNLHVQVRVEATDTSDLIAASLRIDGGEWNPLDDLANLTGRSTMRSFGAHVLEVSVTDSAGNVGYTSAEFRVEPPGKGFEPTSDFLVAMSIIIAVAIAATIWSLHGRRRRTRPHH